MIWIAGFFVWWAIGIIVVFASNINDRDPMDDFDIEDLFFDFQFSFFGPLLALVFIWCLIGDIIIIKGKKK